MSSQKHLTHLMIDLETTGVATGSVVLSLACVDFTFEDHLSVEDYLNRSIFIKFNVEEQIKKYKRTSSAVTLQWWKDQSNESKLISFIPNNNLDVTLEVGLKKFNSFLHFTNYDQKNSYVWSRGSHFDIPKVESLYENLQSFGSTVSLPFNTFRVRDTRTYIDLLTGSTTAYYDLMEKPDFNFVKHNPVHDCILEIKKMQEIYKHNYD